MKDLERKVANLFMDNVSLTTKLKAIREVERQQQEEIASLKEQLMQAEVMHFCVYTWNPTVHLVVINRHSNVYNRSTLCVCYVCSSKPARLINSLIHLNVLKYFIHNISMFWINPIQGCREVGFQGFQETPFQAASYTLTI